MQIPNANHAEPGRAIAPDSARPTEQEIAALAYEFWKARGCPDWLWGRLKTAVPRATHAASVE